MAEAFERLWQPPHQPVEPPEPVVREVIERQMNRLYYHVSDRTWKDTWYRGTRLYKCPTDMWVYQEIIDDLRPGLVVETGTFRGGSASFIADRLDLLGHGEVVTVDITELPDQPQHPRLSYLIASSTAPDLLAEIRRRLPTDGSPVVVILDSDHSHQHVLDELRAYAPLVTPGSYLIVEDTNVNGHPVAPAHGPGPWEAVQEFLAETDQFDIDPRGERYFLTQNPGGFLRKIDTAEQTGTGDVTVSSTDVASSSGRRRPDDPAELAIDIVSDMEVTGETPAVVLVLPGLSAGQAFAGIRTAVVAGATMADLTRRPLHIVLAGDSHGDVDDLHTELRAIISGQGLGQIADSLRLTRPDDCGRQHHRADLWMVTYWTTALAVADAIEKNLIDRDRVVYLIQDYEPGFYAWGHQHAQALSTYRQGFVPLVNSSTLARHLVQEGVADVDDRRVFAPEVDSAPVHRASAAWAPSADGEIRVLFYARPSKPRNMYDTGIDALRRWAEGLPDGVRATVSLSGESISVPPLLGDNVTTRTLGKLDYAGYYEELQHTDVGLALMLSPHPGHLALELPMSGIPTVTNEFVGVRAAWVPGLHLAAADPRSLAVALSAATQAARGLSEHSTHEVPDSLGGPLRSAVAAALEELDLD